MKLAYSRFVFMIGAAIRVFYSLSLLVLGACSHTEEKRESIDLPLTSSPPLGETRVESAKDLQTAPNSLEDFRSRSDNPYYRSNQGSFDHNGNNVSAPGDKSFVPPSSY